MKETQQLIDIHKLQRKIEALLEKVLPYTLYRYIWFLWKKIRRRGKWPYTEAYFLKWRPFSREKYCIVRLEYLTYAHFSAAQEYIFSAEHARHKGMHPIIALQWRCDLKNNNLCAENEWETIFQQQKIQDILDRKATILVSKVNAADILRIMDTSIDINNDPKDTRIHATEDNWRNYYKNAHKYAKKYWRFNQYVVDGTKKKFAQMFQHEESVLGVALREDFSEEYNILIKNMDIKKVYDEHPLGPSVSEILDIVEECLNRWSCDKIFVASVYSDSIKKFEERFPDKIIYCKRERMTMEETMKQLNSRRKLIEDSMGEDQAYRDKSHRIAIEYAQETILLSKCTYLIGAKSGQTIAALTLNGGQYKDIKVLEDKNHIAIY